MTIAGIVAEYNPFHRGHAYQIQKLREDFGENTAVVCVMSGDFVQRGEPAMFSKYARAKAAVQCGADLILELPVPYSVASAERFAQGAVDIFGKLGVIDYLVFGSECGHVQLLCDTADILRSPQFHDLVRGNLRSGCSYPTARSAAISQLMSGEDVTVLPNDTLGVEYIKAIKEFGYTMQPYVIKREGAMHDCVSDGVIKSGSEIREIAASGNDYAAFVPEGAYSVYLDETKKGRGPVTAECLEQAILSRLRMCTAEQLAELPDAAEGLENRLLKACRTRCTLEDIYASVKSKRYTHARIRRMTMGAALGLSKQDYLYPIQFARVLALNTRGAEALRKAQECSELTVISKPAVAKQLDEGNLCLFEKTASAHDLYVLGYSAAAERVGDMDWTTSPIFVR